MIEKRKSGAKTPFSSAPQPPKSPAPPHPGTLYVVSTPIGNLEDITLRALRTLQEADLIAAEDTRKTRKLLTHYQISSPLTSYHDHNTEFRSAFLIERLKEGQNVVLVSEAGTPGISDPGYSLVRQALQEEIPVVPVPGPTALIAALSVSGLPLDRFAFEGFLPRKEGKRRKRLERLRGEERTVILYESPHRLIRLLEEIRGVLGVDRPIVVAKEVTKLYEGFYRGNAGEILDRLRGEKVLGEYTVLIAGVSPEVGK